ncbi:MAG: type II toxin-antitoxin system HicA family toxin [Candidatus Brocadiales bacterium]
MKRDLPVLRPKEVIRALLRAGFYIHHQKGSHAQLRHTTKVDLRVTIPRHDSFDLPRPVLRSILRQAQLSLEEFTEFL